MSYSYRTVSMDYLPGFVLYSSIPISVSWDGRVCMCSFKGLLRTTGTDPVETFSKMKSEIADIIEDYNADVTDKSVAPTIRALKKFVRFS